MNRNVTKREIVISFLVIGILVLLVNIIPNFFDNSSQNEPPVYTPPTPPNLTYSEARGVVAAATSASTPAIIRSSGWSKAEWYPSSRQWHVTVWSSKEDSEQYAGITYIVDDATGKVLNPPPVYTPK